MNLEEFYFKAPDLPGAMSRPKVPSHEPAYLEEMFLPHAGVLRELFGISGEKFVAEINKDLACLVFGIQDLFEDLEQFRRDAMEAGAKRLSNLSSDPERNTPDIFTEIIEENSWEDRRDDISGRFLGMDLFDLQKTTALPEKLLAELSWRPGEETEFFAEGEFRGSPLRIWPVFKRPFIQLGVDTIVSISTAF